MSFSGDIGSFNTKVQKEFVEVKKRAAFGLFSAIVMDTPVDKGVLRNNWQMQFNSSADNTLTEGDMSGSGVLSRLKINLENATPVNSIFFTNNLSYAKPIEYDGWSLMAPQGMLRVNLVRWPQIVQLSMRKL